MNIAEATNELTGRPLVFGDDKQIKAHRFLNDLESAKEAVSNCKEGHLDATRCRTCHGESFLKCSECGEPRTCKTCKGHGFSGDLTEDVLSCKCMKKFNDEVKKAIADWVLEKQREVARA